MFDSVLFPGRPFSRLTSSPRRQVDTLSIGRFRLFIFIFFSFSPVNVSGRKWNANSRSEIIIFPDFNTYTHVCLYRRIISFRVLSSLFHPSRTHHCSLTPWRLDVTSWEKFFYDRKIRGNSHQGKLGDLSGDRAFYPISAISLDSVLFEANRPVLHSRNHHSLASKLCVYPPRSIVASIFITQAVYTDPALAALRDSYYYSPLFHEENSK